MRCVEVLCLLRLNEIIFMRYCYTIADVRLCTYIYALFYLSHTNHIRNNAILFGRIQFNKRNIIFPFINNIAYDINYLPRYIVVLFIKQ